MALPLFPAVHKVSVFRLGGIFCLPPQIVCSSSFYLSRRAQLAGLISLTVLGCATNQSFDTAETPQERAQRERQERAERDRGRVGKIDRSPAAVAEKWSGTTARYEYLCLDQMNVSRCTYREITRLDGECKTLTARRASVLLPLNCPKITRSDYDS